MLFISFIFTKISKSAFFWLKNESVKGSLCAIFLPTVVAKKKKKVVFFVVLLALFICFVVIFVFFSFVTLAT